MKAFDKWDHEYFTKNGRLSSRAEIWQAALASVRLPERKFIPSKGPQSNIHRRDLGFNECLDEIYSKNPALNKTEVEEK